MKGQNGTRAMLGGAVTQPPVVVSKNLNRSSYRQCGGWETAAPDPAVNVGPALVAVPVTFEKPACRRAAALHPTESLRLRIFR